MAANLLTEDSWKKVAQKFKIKDKELQQALFFYENNLEENDWDLRLKTLAKIGALANNFKRAKELASAREALKYLSDLAAAAESQKSEVTKQKAAAAKTDAAAQKEEPAQRESKPEEDGAYGELLLKAFQTLKGVQDLVYEVIICEAKPLGVMLAKKIGAQHKATLTKVTGSKRFLPVGTCIFQDGKFKFSFEAKVSGMARRMQEAVVHHTGKKFPLVVGTESTDGEMEADTKPVSAPAAGEAPVPDSPASPAESAQQAAEEKKDLEERRAMFKKARAAWVTVKAKAEADLEKVKAGARMQYLADAEQYPKIQKGCQDIDAILDHLDDELRDTLDQYASTPLTNQPKLHALGQSASKVLDRYLSYVNNDPILKAIDKKEFADVVVHAPIVKALTALRKALA
jgi:hypothetical protein